MTGRRQEGRKVRRNGRGRKKQEGERLEGIETKKIIRKGNGGKRRFRKGENKLYI